MKEVLARSSGAIKLGRAGEGCHLSVGFDLHEFEEEFPGGYPLLLGKRNGDETIYPIPLSVRDDMAWWLVSEEDTAKPGYGYCELQWYQGEVHKKSGIYATFVMRSLSSNPEERTPGESWYESILKIIGDLQKLNTKNKDTIVDAINEVLGQLETLNIDVLTDAELEQLLRETGMCPAVTSGGAYLTDENGKILMW